MNEMDMMSPEKVAAKYGGDKQKIGQAAQMGLLNPTVAVMAGMFIDRMRGAAAKEQAPQSTVAQDTMAPAQAAPAGLGAISQAPMEGGLEALPTPNLDNAEYAGGGIVAFQGGDLVRGIGTETYPASLSQTQTDPATLRAYYLSRGMPLPPELMTSEERLKVTKPGFDYYYKAAGIEPPKFPKLTSDAPLTGSLMASELGMDGTQLSEIPRGMDSIDTLRAKAAASKASMSPENRTLYDENISGVKRIAEDVAPKGKAPEKTETAKGAKATAPAPTKEETTEDFLARRKRMLREAGVSEDPFGADRAAAKTRAEEIAAQRKENQAISMIMGGLSGMGARNLAEFAQKAGTAGFGQYMKGEKEAREDQKEIDKINRDLSKAEDAMKRGDVDKALEFEDKAKQREIQLRGVQAQERSAARPTSTAELLAALQSPNPAVRRAAETVLGSAKTGQVDERFLMERWDKMDRMEKFNLARQGIGYEQWAAGKRAEAAGGGTGGFKVLGKE
jgi:hypothetical protein